ncbi:sugar phosphate isomerase/epimerase [Clostridium sp. AM58-1XD]|uniref:sugar phosphate isomerase/epimerase family protein n=1 Tax=Clostridium sp. AM58-1XD TaxID=2292307 RepID=UPI000E4E8A31|nr:sugar phosphate isomerase/epimerase [Clostridium sp. AM58-1XD]RGY98877.1 sugar phosphate isomerase/epimerase [Clostridium sp. AM58-1XD]
MKLCYPVATPDSNVSLMAFWGEKQFENNVKAIAEIGYQGVELLVRDGSQVDEEYIKSILARYGLEAAAVGSSPIFTQEKLTLANKDPENRKLALERAKAGIDFASSFKVPYCIGKFRGNVDEAAAGSTMADLTETLKAIAEYAAEKEVTVLLEPQSAPGINNLHTVGEVLAKTVEIGAENIGLLLDMFHMDIAEISMCAAVVQSGKRTCFIHASENKRLPVGTGRLSVSDMIEMLKVTGYNGYISVEVLQRPDSYTAAKISYHTLNYWMNR